MQRFFHIFIDFVWQGALAIYRFVGAILSWATGQISNIAPFPWEDWPMWRLLVLGFLLFGVGWSLWWAIAELWGALKKIGAALVTMMAVLIKTLPQILIACLLGLVGIWVLTRDYSGFRKPSFLPGYRLVDPWYSDCSDRDCRR